MFGLISKLFLIALVIGVMLMMAACSGSMPPAQDIPATAPAQDLAAPKNQPAVEAKIVNEPIPTASLPTEITEPNSPVAPAPSPTESGQQAAIPANQGIQPLPGSETALAAAIADLSKQVGLSADQITLVSMEAQEWGDTSLGCPQPGMMYAQVITPGYLMVLEAQGQQYKYHTDQRTSVIWCKK
jgi:hypothetical protein